MSQRPRECQDVAAIHPVTLKFADTAKEAAYCAATAAAAASSEPWMHNMHVTAAAVRFGVSAVMLSNGSLFTWLSAFIILPYLSLALTQRQLAQSVFYERHRLACAMAFEAAYIAIGMNGAPTWDLVAAKNIRSYMRVLILGPGTCFITWQAFWTRKPFTVDIIVIPVEFALMSWALVRPVCGQLEGTPFAVATCHALSDALDALATAVMPRSCPHYSCRSIVVTWQTISCIALLYMRYRLEQRRRMRFVAPARLKTGWPVLPRTVVIVLHAALALQLFAVVWGVLHCARV